MKEKYRLTVSFQGMALEDHSIDVNHLAPSMIALGQLFQDANYVLNKGEGGGISTKAVATSKGSFEITFLLDQALKGLFVTTSVIPVSQIAQYLFFDVEVSLSLSSLLKRLKGKKPKKIQETQHNIHITNNDGNIEIINRPVYNMYNDSKVVNGYGKTAQPVTTDGIDEMRFIGEKNQKEIITKEDYDYYSIEDIEEEILSDNVLENQLMDILSIGKIHYKWYLKHGTEQKHYTITDPEFLAEQKSGQRISVEKDMLKADIRYLQKRNKKTGQITIEREIIRAKIIYNKEEQLKLGYNKEDDEN